MDNVKQETGNIKGILRNYISEFLHFSGIKAALSLGLFLFLGLSQGVGLMLIVPLLYTLGLTGSGEPGTVSGVTRIIGKIFLTLGFSLNLYTVLAAYVLVVSLFAVLKRFQSVVNVSLQQGFVHYLRHRLYEALTYAQWTFTLTRKSSDITHALTSDIQRVGAGTNTFLQFFGEIAIVVFHVAVAMLLSVPLTLATLVFGVGMMLLMRPLNRKAQDTGRWFRSSRKDLFGVVMEHLVGMKTAKSCGVEDRHIEKMKLINQQIETQQVNFIKIRATSRMFYEIAAVVAVAVYFAAAFKIKALHLPVAQLLVLVFIFSRLMPRFSSLVQSIQSIKNMLPSFSGINRLYREAVAAREMTAGPSAEQFEFHHRITFHDVSFRYTDESKRNALDHVTFEIPAKSVTAVTGPSGAGKSTLADLLLGLLKPDTGKIEVDGKELIGDNVLNWRHTIGYVPQETFLFHDTIRANLLWVMPEIEEAEMWRVLRMAAAEDFVKGLPNGLDTIVGDRGITLSGGERQRIALARALLRNPQLLLLDEATSALDKENERRIHDALQALRGQLTIVIIAHRDSTLRLADKIIHLTEGKIQ